jgi:hypothetical protein
LNKKIIILLIYSFVCVSSSGQPAPAADENIPYLMTFGGNADPSWGDDDFCQLFFCVIPPSFKQSVYIRIFDPDTGGSIDELKGAFNTVVRFSVYGGPKCWSDTVSQSIYASRGNFKSGYQMASKSFGADAKYNAKWYTFGPFNPSEGEYVEKLGGNVFKIIAEGVSGDDGNLYRYFISSEPEANKPVEGGNLFTYKYHFRMPDNPKQVCQIYPFADDKTISVEVRNFDWDNDGIIRVFSVAKNGIESRVSGENNWETEIYPIVEEEKNSSLEVQFIKSQTSVIRNNNVVVTVRNQYGVSLPFYVIPIGGIPVYTPKIKMK